MSVMGWSDTSSHSWRAQKREAHTRWVTLTTARRLSVSVQSGQAGNDGPRDLRCRLDPPRMRASIKSRRGASFQTPVLSVSRSILCDLHTIA